ncbi:hypothetical protein [Rhizobium sp. Leaf383]|uniref:hypothetical protein n=1 Tax=Rhizobium sp. Leaf383 TaxID=1736357 RepID=UPI000712E4BF|nr:hypothetical protein [Rhizobium sp. Leaf383]KQS84249.1 hypothetical protein ASG58_20995 [Rhizobium sp. Leaf383]
MYFEVVGGDFEGKAFPTKSMFGGVKAKNFRGLRIISAQKTYEPGEIVRFKDFGAVASLDVNAAAMALAGGVAFGTVGAIAGGLAGKQPVWTVGIEFSDGKKAILRTNRPQDANMQILRKFIETKHLEKFDF